MELSGIMARHYGFRFGSVTLPFDSDCGALDTAVTAHVEASLRALLNLTTMFRRHNTTATGLELTQAIQCLKNLRISSISQNQ